MHKPSARTACIHISFNRRMIALAVASCFATGTALANPTGATVTSGSAAISSSGSTLTITNTPNAIINWHDFSINTGETTQFIQQSAASAVLNRITGGNPSLILGTLQSNGRVFLINPAGIVFGAGSVVDVAGLVASTLNITDADFLAGKHIYNANIANPGNVTNAGEIRTPTGGFVYLIGTKVENSGIINTPSGEAILAAGNSVEIVDSTDPSLRVTVSAQSQDVNLSQLMLQNDGNIFGVLNSGRVSANTVTQDATGKTYFRSAGFIQTTADSITEAKGTATLDGGHIQSFADTVGVYAGTFDASGKDGGFIETSGHYLSISDISVRANALNPSGTAGIWLLDPYNITIDGVTSNGSFSGGDPSTFTPTASGSSVYGGDISTALSSGTSVIITTNGSGSESGNITLDTSILKNGGGDATLTLLANNDITINGGWGITSTVGKLNVVLNADSDANGGGSISMLYDTAGAQILSNGGNIVFGGGTNPLTSNANSINFVSSTVDSYGGSIFMNAGAGGIHITDSNFYAGSSLSGALSMNAGSGGIHITNSSLYSGALNINTSTLDMSDGSFFISDLTTNVIVSGALTMDSSKIVGGNASAGFTTVKAGSITMTDTLFSDETYIEGDAGLLVDVTGAIILDSAAIRGGDASGLTTVKAESLSIADTYSTGENFVYGTNGLSVDIKNNISLQDDSYIGHQSGTGLVNIKAGSVNLDNSNFFSNTDLTLNAQTGALAPDIALANGAYIEASNILSIGQTTPFRNITLTGNSFIDGDKMQLAATGLINLTDSSIYGFNLPSTISAGSLSLDNSFIRSYSSPLTLNVSGSASLSNFSSLQAYDSLSFSSGGNLSLASGSFIQNDITGQSSISVGGSLSMNNNAKIKTLGNLALSTGSTSLTDSIITSSGTLSLATSSLTETRSSFGAPSTNPTPTFITINSGGNIILNDGSDIVALNEVHITTGGKIYLNTGTSGESHISTYSNNTIFLFFPTLFSGGFVVDGIEGNIVSLINPFTGFFTGSGLDTPAILNSNLFITYGGGQLAGVAGQNNTNTLATNPYIDPYGPNQTGPGDSSLTYGVTGDPWVNDDFSGVRECS